MMHKDTLAELLRQECHDFTQRMLAKYRAYTIKFDAAVSLYQEDVKVGFTIRLPSNAPTEPDLKDMPGILSSLRDQVDAILKAVPWVHWLVNVGDDPHRVGTACSQWSWYSFKPTLLDPNRPANNPVTCPRCLEYMASLADNPVIVKATYAPSEVK